MSICAIEDRTILLNITNMDDRGGDNIKEFISTEHFVNEVREQPKGVKADTTPLPASPISNATINALSDGRNTQRKIRLGNTNRKDSLRSMDEIPGKIGSGSGSGEAEIIHSDDIFDPAAKKRKTRRGKPKHRKLKPYAKQQSYEQRLRCRGIGRLTKTGGQPPAPYNTTQFLMEDHSDLPDLEQKLADAVTSEIPSSFQKPLAPPRTRDSSFSIDSDEDFFYSSPEDEEEFLTKEFSSAYEDLHAERLNMMSKTELIQEYVQLEAKLDLMTKRLRGKNFQQLEERENDKNNVTETTSDTEISKKLKIFQQRIDDLIQQNEQLRRDNEALRAKKFSSPVSSVDSESDSDSTTNENHSSCSRSDAESTTGKSYQSRREKERRRSKRVSSVDSETDSSTTTSSKNDTNIQNENSKSLINELPNGNSTNHEIGLPT